MKNWFKVWGNDVMEFYCHPDFEDIIPEPRPAVKYLPKWFKDLAPTFDAGKRDVFGNPTMTAKKCLPMLDAMSLGFTIPLGGDLHVTTNHNCTQIEIKNPPAFSVAEFHDSAQVGGKRAFGFPHGNPKRNSFNNRKPKIRKMTESEKERIKKIQKAQESRTHHYTWELRKRKHEDE